MTCKRMVSILAIGLLLSACGLKTETFKELYTRDISKVTKIEIQSGRTGKLKIVTDQKVIQHFLAEVNEIKYVPNRNQEKEKGYRYRVTLYATHNKFVFTENEINDHLYHSNPAVLPLIEKLYNITR